MGRGKLKGAPQCPLFGFHGVLPPRLIRRALTAQHRARNAIWMIVIMRHPFGLILIDTAIVADVQINFAC